MEAVEPSKELSLLDRIRNMWEFANLAQWIFIFGRAVKLDENLDIEVGFSPSARYTSVRWESENRDTDLSGIGNGMSQDALDSPGRDRSGSS
jgi:hypothetical protein